MRPRIAPLLVLPLLVGCGPGTPTGAAPEQRLEGTYVVVAPPSPFEGEERIELSFTRDGLGFVAGCNGHQAPEATWDDGTLHVGGFSSTEVGCPGDGNAEDAWLAEFLQSGPALAVAGVAVTLTRGDVSLAMLPADRAAPPPGQEDRPLAGTRWRLTGIEERDGDAVGVRGVPRRTGAVLVIEDGGIRFRTGCNTGGGEVEVDGDRLALGQVVITQRGCPGAAAGVEGPQVDVLMGRTATWAVDGGTLRVGRGRTTLLYAADE